MGHDDRHSSKFLHFIQIYELFMGPFRYRANGVNLLEIGVGNGGSLQVWKKYLGPTAEIYGIDKNAVTECLNDEQIKVFVGDQSNREFLGKVAGKIKKLDIVIDDGGHAPLEQIASFDVLFPIVAPGGIYIVEDLHNSYRPEYRGDLTFIDHAKRYIDLMNEKHLNLSFHFYPFLAVIEKATHDLRSPVHVGKVRL